MKCIRRIRKLCCLTAALVMAAGCCLAETEIRVEDRGLDLSDEISIHYPAVTGLADAELEERFYSGEVAHLLQQGQSERVWGQRVGVDKYPVFWDDKVDSPAP